MSEPGADTGAGVTADNDGMDEGNESFPMDGRCNKLLGLVATWASSAVLGTGEEAKWYRELLDPAEVTEGSSAGGEPDIDWRVKAARGLHPRALADHGRCNESLSGPELNRGCPNGAAVRLGG